MSNCFFALSEFLLISVFFLVSSLSLDLWFGLFLPSCNNFSEFSQMLSVVSDESLLIFVFLWFLFLILFT